MEKLYKSTHKIVYGYMYTLSSDPLLAEDLTQEVYLQAIRSINRYNGRCKFSVWLCQIGKHLWYRHLEKSKREIPMGDDIYDLADRRKVYGSAEEEVICGFEVKELLNYISLMGEDMRHVIILRIFFEYSFREIGFIMSKSENWARVTFYRGKEKIIKNREERYGK